ncbi:MAG: DUF1499 domain-containing protein [Xanthobacteraceae bacterium]|nr:MAG: DUF1499 domain-containing protein [Xanthobacteraceae bacterium]
MARRLAAPLHLEPVSPLAAWARHLAVFAMIAAIVSIIIVRFGFLEIRPALATFLGALACAGLSILVALAGFTAIWRNGSRGMSVIFAALLLDALILAYPAYLAVQFYRLPRIYDVTTDPIDPPRFEALARLRGGDGANAAAYAGLYSAEQQQMAYPDIEPVSLDVAPQKAYDVTLDLITKRRWRIVDARPPQPRREGHIEAVARSPVMGFRDDVVVRVMADGEGSRIDLRSSSRYFEHDLGANAARVTRLIDDINEAVDAAAKPAKKAQPAAKSVQPGKRAPKR